MSGAIIPPEWDVTPVIRRGDSTHAERVRVQLVHNLAMSPDLWKPAESLAAAIKILDRIVSETFEQQDFR